MCLQKVGAACCFISMDVDIATHAPSLNRRVVAARTEDDSSPCGDRRPHTRDEHRSAPLIGPSCRFGVPAETVHDPNRVDRSGRISTECVREMELPFGVVEPFCFGGGEVFVDNRVLR